MTNGMTYMFMPEHLCKGMIEISVVWIDSEEELDSYLDSEQKVVIDFSAPGWCRPCQQLQPHFDKAAALEPDAKFLAVDVDKAPWAMQRFGVQSVPTVMLYEGGTYVKNIIGRTVVQILNELR